nr:EAL domain-containing protein [Lachnospiraceae bacterium]
PENIIIEFTETTSEEDQKRLKETVENLKKMGFRVSVDDFGIGYSSLSMIRDIHFDELKIDKSFMDTDGENYERKLVLMKHVLGLAEEFNMSTIAEGAETIEQVKLLDKLGCKQVQGYYFDKPMPPELFENRLKKPKYELN